jgi:hypothetical protein
MGISNASSLQDVLITLAMSGYQDVGGLSLCNTILSIFNIYLINDQFFGKKRIYLHKIDCW